jgi:hypothetical protein
MANPSRPRRALRRRQHLHRRTRHRPPQLHPGPHRRRPRQPLRPGPHRRRLRPQLRPPDRRRPRRRLRSAPHRRQHRLRTRRRQRPHRHILCHHRTPCHRHPRPPRPRLLRRSLRRLPVPLRPCSLKRSRRCNLKFSMSRRLRHLPVHRLPAAQAKESICVTERRGTPQRRMPHPLRRQTLHRLRTLHREHRLPAARARENICAMDRRGTPRRMPPPLRRRTPHRPQHLTQRQPLRRQRRMPLPRAPLPEGRPHCRPERPPAPHRSCVMPHRRSLHRFRPCRRLPRP